jgi:hypothetical protein
MANSAARVRGSHRIDSIPLIAPYDLPDLYNHQHCFSQVDLDHLDYARFPHFRNIRVIDLVIGLSDLFLLAEQVLQVLLQLARRIVEFIHQPRCGVLERSSFHQRQPHGVSHGM